MFKRETLFAAAALFVATSTGLTIDPAAAADVYPNRVVKLIVPFPAGQATDILARVIQEKLSIAWGQPVIVENRAGAGGALGAEAAKMADPDGYTLFFGAVGPLVVAPAFNSKLRYNPQTDFTPITAVAIVPQVIAVSASSPYKSLAELITAAKAAPGKLTYASSGPGSASHLTMELFKQTVGIDVLHVPFKGAVDAYTSVLSGNVDMLFDAGPGVAPLIKAGTLRALGVSTLKRNPYMPTIPTIAEQGLPGFETLAWMGVVGPRGLPSEIQTKVHDEIVAALAKPDVQERLVQMGAIGLGNSPDQFRDFMKTEFEKWQSVVNRAGIRAE